MPSPEKPTASAVGQVTVLGHVAWFLVLWALCYSVLMVLACMTTAIFSWYGETPNIFYTFLGIVALAVAVTLLILGVAP